MATTILFLVSTARATISQDGTSLQTQEAGAKEKKRWGLSTSLSFSRPTVNQEEATYRESSNISLAPRYKFSDKFSLSALISGSQRYGKEKKIQWSTGRVSLQLPYSKGDYTNRSFSVYGTLPVNYRLREFNSYRGSFGASMGVSPGQKVLLGSWGVSYRLGLQYNFYEFDTAKSGQFNSRLNLSNSFYISYRPVASLPKWSFSASAGLNSSYNYGGRLISSFSISQSVSYALSRSVTLGLGHQNGGSTLDVDGESSNVKLYDIDYSSVYMFVSHVY